MLLCFCATGLRFSAYWLNRVHCFRPRRASDAQAAAWVAAARGVLEGTHMLVDGLAGEAGAALARNEQLYKGLMMSLAQLGCALDSLHCASLAFFNAAAGRTVPLQGPGAKPQGAGWAAPDPKQVGMCLAWPGLAWHVLVLQLSATWHQPL